MCGIWSLLNTMLRGISQMITRLIKISKRTLIQWLEGTWLVIGHLLLKIPVAANEVRSVLREASTSRSFCKNRVIGAESDDGGDGDWTWSSLLKEANPAYSKDTMVTLRVISMAKQEA